ncbi:MAG: MFS transporter [Thermoplasmata archaeon]
MASKRRALVAMGLYHAANDGTVVAIPALFPLLLAENVLTSFTQIGILLSVALGITVVFQIVFGTWSDRGPMRLLLPAGMVILGVASLFTALAQTFAVLLLFVAIGRIGASVYHPVGISWVGKVFRRDVDRAMGFQSALGDVGVIIAFASSGYLGLLYGWQVPLVLWGGFALVVAVVGTVLTRQERSPPPVASARRAPPWNKIVRRVALWIVPLSIGGAAYTITIGFGNSLLIQRLAFTEDTANLVIALWIAAGVLAAYSYGRISATVGRFRALVSAFLVVGFAGLILSLAPPPPLLIPTFLVFGIALFITYPALFAFISESTEDVIGGATFGVVFGFQLIGGALTGYAAGLMADAWGIHTPFLLLMALGFVGFLLLMGATPSHLRNKRPQEKATRTAT